MILPPETLEALAKDLNLGDLIRIADVGANPTEEHVYQPLVDAGLCDVIGFEPNEEAFARLEKYQTERTRFLNEAIGDGSPVDFHSYPSPSMSSIFPLSARSLRFLGRFRGQIGQEKLSQTNTRKLDDIEAVPPLDFLKMDVQGAELGILKSGRQKLRHAVAVVVEMRFYQLYENEPMMGHLDLELRRQGFVLHRFLHQKSLMLRHSQGRRVKPQVMGTQLIDGDAVYIRSLEVPRRWDDRQLKALALLAHAVFKSYDLTLLCLDYLIKRKAVPEDLAARYVDRFPAQFLANRA